MNQVVPNSTTTDIEELKSKIVDKVQSVNYYSEGVHASIQSTIFPAEGDIYVHVTSIDINSLRFISIIRANNHFPNLYKPLPP